MAASRKEGKLLLLLSFFIFISSFLVSDLMISPPRFSYFAVLASESNQSPNSNPVIEQHSQNENLIKENAVFLKEQKLQLEKLQELVQNLTLLVSRLESQFPDSPLQVENLPSASPPRPPSPPSDDGRKNSERTKEEIFTVEGLKKGASDSRGTVLKYNTFWSENFQFVSAVKLKSAPTCLNVLPYKDHEGLSKYYAVGDDKGKLYVFFKTGDVSLEIDPSPDPDNASPVTVVVSVLSVFKNETMVVTGHENGVVVIHRVWEILNGDDWNSLQAERLGRFESPGGAGIHLLEVHNVGRKRYILATDGGGTIMVLGKDGKLYGSVTPSRRPIVFLKQRLLFLTENGAGSLDLRSMKLKETECEGLNNSSVTSYAFDVVDRTKAYGFTSEGDLVHTLLLGDFMNFKCRIRLRRKLDLDGPVVLQTIRGYLVVSNKEKVYVYNVSTQHYVRAGGPRLLFSTGLDEIMSSFLNQQAVDLENDGTALSVPLVGSDFEKVVVVGLGNGYVAMYRSNLPVFRNEFNSILWTSPVLFFIIFLFVAWHFFANKKDTLTSWDSDVPCPAPVTGRATLGSSGANDRMFSESSRNSDIMDRRGNSGLRSTPRYVSPPQIYGQPTSYRTGGDMDSRTVSVDPRFRTTSEITYRGSHVEGHGVTNGRDALFVNGVHGEDDRN
ncbi:hypothetical protein OROGR_004508 [Orobanche gracilis]